MVIFPKPTNFQTDRQRK